RTALQDVKFDIIGMIFQRLIPEDERRVLGQYFTSPDIVDLILKFCLRSPDDKVLDPSCGSGTFLVRAYHHKKQMEPSLKHNDILTTLWGVDIAKFPAHLATINLAIGDLRVRENHPQILANDFFNLRLSGSKHDTVTLSDKATKIPFPRDLDCIVGNPPYTRQEQIEELVGDSGGYKNKITSAATEGFSRLKIPGQASIYFHFFVHGTKFLKEGGRFGYIVSESWLDTRYGAALQEFFLRHYKIVAIISSKIERWFSDADINTCIVILEKCTPQGERDKNLVRFVQFYKPLRYFIPPTTDMWNQQADRLLRIDQFVQQILSHRALYISDDLRVFAKKQSDLWDEGFDENKKKYLGSKWGKYLRAPEIYFAILKKAGQNSRILADLAQVRRGFTTGANEFFYLTEEQLKRHKIEREFWTHRGKGGNLIPNFVIISPKDISSVVLNPD
ncbi:MAG: HsdM family class I SAM-dependent methyltransferase, partial [Terriglobia bacterium]